MFGIVIGIAAVIAILSIGRGFEKDTIESLTPNESEEIEINLQFAPDDPALYYSNMDLIQSSDFSLLETIDGVEKVSYPKTDLEYIYQDINVRGKTRNKRIGAITSNGKSVQSGRKLTSYDNQVGNKVITIDADTAKDLFSHANSAVGRGLEINGEVYTIVGVYPTGAGMTMFSAEEASIEMPKKTYEKFFQNVQETSAAVLTLDSAAKPSQITDKAVKLLEKNGALRDQGTYSVSDMAMMTDGISSVLNTITLFISAVAGISLFIAGVGVMNMMYISVSERTKEIGIRRALGATRGAIRTQFLLEGVTLTLVGGFIGYLLGMIVAYAIGSAMDISVSVDFFTVALAVGVSGGIGLIFSVMPASEAAKKDLIDILR